MQAAHREYPEYLDEQVYEDGSLRESQRKLRRSIHASRISEHIKDLARSVISYGEQEVDQRTSYWKMRGYLFAALTAFLACMLAWMSIFLWKAALSWGLSDVEASAVVLATLGAVSAVLAGVFFGGRKRRRKNLENRIERLRQEQLTTVSNQSSAIVSIGRGFVREETKAAVKRYSPTIALGALIAGFLYGFGR